MKYFIRVFLIAFINFRACDIALAEQQIYSPDYGSPERKLITNVLRSAVGKELKKTVIFKIDSLKILDNWAFLTGTPLEKNGMPIDYHNTPYQEMIDMGIFDDSISALLHQDNGHWQVITYAIGSTDVPFIDWAKNYHAPDAIFKFKH